MPWYLHLKLSQGFNLAPTDENIWNLSPQKPNSVPQTQPTQVQAPAQQPPTHSPIDQILDALEIQDYWQRIRTVIDTWAKAGHNEQIAEALAAHGIVPLNIDEAPTEDFVKAPAGRLPRPALYDAKTRRQRLAVGWK